MHRAPSAGLVTAIRRPPAAHFWWARRFVIIVMIVILEGECVLSSHGYLHEIRHSPSSW
jgi:hypothetical protein